MVLGGSAFLFLVGLVDDILSIRPYQKLIGQLIGAGILVSLLHTDALPRGLSIATIVAPGGPLGVLAVAAGGGVRRRQRPGDGRACGFL